MNGWPGFFPVPSFKRRGPRTAIGGTSTLMLRTLSRPSNCVAPGPGVLSGVKEAVGQNSVKQETALFHRPEMKCPRTGGERRQGPPGRKGKAQAPGRSF